MRLQRIERIVGDVINKLRRPIIDEIDAGRQELEHCWSQYYSSVHEPHDSSTYCAIYPYE